MQKQRVKTSMSVPEMGKMLGLGKVESYWLVKKNYFKTGYTRCIGRFERQRCY